MENSRDRMADDASAAVGCAVCGRTGYQGRFALHEVMLVTEEIERLIIERRSTEDLHKTADRPGHAHPARTTVCARPRAGITSLEEIFRVVS